MREALVDRPWGDDRVLRLRRRRRPLPPARSGAHPLRWPLSPTKRNFAGALEPSAPWIDEVRRRVGGLPGRRTAGDADDERDDRSATLRGRRRCTGSSRRFRCPRPTAATAATRQDDTPQGLTRFLSRICALPAWSETRFTRWYVPAAARWCAGCAPFATAVGIAARRISERGTAAARAARAACGWVRRFIMVVPSVTPTWPPAGERASARPRMATTDVTAGRGR